MLRKAVVEIDQLFFRQSSAGLLPNVSFRFVSWLSAWLLKWPDPDSTNKWQSDEKIGRLAPLAEHPMQAPAVSFERSLSVA